MSKDRLVSKCGRRVAAHEELRKGWGWRETKHLEDKCWEGSTSPKGRERQFLPGEFLHSHSSTSRTPWSLWWWCCTHQRNPTGLSVCSSVVTVLGRKRNTHPGRGTVFCNQIPTSKSNPRGLWREFHPEWDLKSYLWYSPTTSILSHINHCTHTDWLC